MCETPRSIDQILSQLTEQPKAIAKLTAGLARRRLHEHPSRDEWSLNDELAHLRACSDVWGKYIALILAEDHPTIRAMNPRKWIKSTDYSDLDFATSFRAFTRQRAKLLALLRPLPAASWSRSVTVTGAGRPLERTMGDYASWLADHERSHVRHMERVVGHTPGRTPARPRRPRTSVRPGPRRP